MLDIPQQNPLKYGFSGIEMYISLSLHNVLLQRQYTPLLEAAETGQTEVVKILIDKGADIEARNDVS